MLTQSILTQLKVNQLANATSLLKISFTVFNTVNEIITYKKLLRKVLGEKIRSQSKEYIRDESGKVIREKSSNQINELSNTIIIHLPLHEKPLKRICLWHC